MEASIATLLLITSAVVLACIVVNYAVSVFECVLDTESLSHMKRIEELQKSLLDQTDTLLNQTQSESPFSEP